MMVVVLWEGSGPSVLPSLAEPFCTKSGVGLLELIITQNSKIIPYFVGPRTL
jgi:hypothetical protein